MKTNYVLVTPAYNEEKFIEETIKSVITQTILPQKWLILDDGSTDATEEIIKKYETRHHFITSVRCNHKDIVSYYGHRTRVVLRGYENIKELEFDFFGVLDADIGLEPTYYEGILTEFNRNPKLGIASGVFFDKIKGQIQKVVREPDEINTPGGFQLFRRECYEAIGGYRILEHGGDDSLANIMARMKGWQTKRFPQFEVIHNRTMGAGKGSNILHTKYRDGQADYILGTHPIFALAKSLRRIFLEKPFFLASIARLSGFYSGYLIGNKGEVPDEVMSYVRKEQLKRLYNRLCGNFKKSL